MVTGITITRKSDLAPCSCQGNGARARLLPCAQKGLPVQDIRLWLQEIGLGHYGDVFARNDVDLDLLPELSDEDLRELGVSLGHRRRILKEIADRPQHEPTQPDTADDPFAAAPAAERRQITVMFCDLVGSTALSESLDPEDLRRLMGAYQSTATAVIRQYDGHIAQYLGDGLLVYFGFPRAHEDDAQRAVRAGLEVIDAIRAIESPIPLAVRVGIATGRVVVGETTSGDSFVPGTAVGETPNRAARLQALADPNTVVIGERTRRLLRGAFELIDLGEHRLKGLSRPVRSFRVGGESDAISRFDAAQSTGVTPLVGRDHEIGLMLERWQQVTDGDGQVLLVSGEAGIGKSRIVSAFLDQLTGASKNLLRYQSSPYHTNTAFQPVIEYFLRAARIRPGDAAPARLEKLEAFAAESGLPREHVVPLFATILAIPLGTRFADVQASPQMQKKRVIEAFADRMVYLSRHQPLVWVFEDAHWGDPTTLELLNSCINRLMGHPVLGIVTCRPEFDPPWGFLPHVTQLLLSRLGRRQSATMVEHVLGGKGASAELINEIATKADGIPLYAEELTKAVIESGTQEDAGDRFHLTGPLSTIAVPDTLHDSLMSRLDREAAARDVAQIAAVIGREFSYALLAAVSGYGEERLDESLDRLLEADLISRRGVGAHASYSFKHALLRDAAYASLLRSDRRRLHARVAEMLELQRFEAIEKQPELLAHHYTHAGDHWQAVEYWLRAGKRAAAMSANEEAIAHLRAGLDVLAMESETEARLRKELEIQVALGVPLIIAKGYAVPDTAEAYNRARDLCDRFGDIEQYPRVLFGLWGYHRMRAELMVARDHAVALMVDAERRDDRVSLIMAHHVIGSTVWNLGQNDAALMYFERLLEIYHPQQDRQLGFSMALDPRTQAQCYLTWIHAALGNTRRAESLMTEALDEVKHLSQPYSSALAHLAGARFYVWQGRASLAEERARTSLAISREQGIPFYQAFSQIVLGLALSRQGQVEEAVSEVERGLAAYRSIDVLLNRPYLLGAYAEVVAEAGRWDDAFNTINEALAIAHDTEERWWESELYRLKGTFLTETVPHDHEQAIDCFKTAISVATRQGAHAFALRAAIDLARLWHSNDHNSNARDTLRPAFDALKDGDATEDLDAARALLATLEGG